MPSNLPHWLESYQVFTSWSGPVFKILERSDLNR